MAQSDTCGICQHPGATTCDHIVPPRLWPRDEFGRMVPGFDAVGNLRPAHGTMGSGRAKVQNRCPTCGRLCNQSRGDGPGPRRPQSRIWFPDRDR